MVIKPTLTSEVAELQDRILSTRKGVITSVQAVYVPADDMTDPAVGAILSHLDTTVILSREQAGKGIYPAVDPLQSESRLVDRHLIGSRHYDVAEGVREHLARYHELEGVGSLATHRTSHFCFLVGCKQICGVTSSGYVTRTMNKDLTFLPQNKRDDLQQIVAIVREHCSDIGMIVLFGSYARGDWREAKDLAPDRKSGHPSDYDILVITPDEEQCGSQVWQAISDACTEARLSATPRIIHHDIGFVNVKLERSHYFFSDIVAEGRLLYDAGLFSLATKRELQAVERLSLAQEDFSEWFESAQQFFEGYKFYYSKSWLKKAAFHLHQSAEAAYKTALLVFTGYIPDEHYLAILSARAAHIDLDFRTVFEAKDDFEHNAFTALEFAYIGARYDKRYTIDEPTVSYLAKRVEALLRLTETRCREKITALQSNTNL